MFTWEVRRLRPFFKDFYDSGFPEKWFGLAGNTLITAATMIVWKEGSFLAGVFALISYLCLASQVTHGTREPYEYLKKIYVYPHSDKWHGVLFDSLIFIFRLHIMFAPILLVWWAYAYEKVPF